MMTKLADIEDVRFRYEVAGESMETICADLRILSSDLRAIVAQQGWQAPVPLGHDASDEDVNEYYKQGRMHLTKHMTRRAIKMFPKISKIEDAVVEAIDDTIGNFDSDHPDASHNLARIVNAYSKLLDKQALLHEAIATPALADKKIEAMLKNTALSTLLDSLDGKGRSLPSEE